MKLSSFIFILLFSSLITCSYSDEIDSVISLLEPWSSINSHELDTILPMYKPYLRTMCPKVETVSNQEDPFSHLMHLRNDDFTVPGSNLLLYGLNLFEYEAFPTEISTAPLFEDMLNNLIASRGITEQLFEMKCSETKKTWTMPDNKNLHRDTPRKYIVPEHIEKAERNAHYDDITDIHYEDSLSNIITSLQGKVTFTTDLKFLGGSTSSLSYGKKIHTMKEEKKKTVEWSQTKIMSTLVTVEYLSLRNFVTSKFVDSWNDLPDKYNKSNDLPYKKFFKMFGTHYFSTAQIGTYHYRKLETREEYMNVNSEDIYRACSEIRVLGKTFNSESSLITPQQYNEFVEKSALTEGYITSGGMLSNNEIEWEKKWPIHPWVISGRVSAIHELIEDEDKGDNVRLALAVMQVKNFIDTYGSEINKIIENYRDRIDYEGQYYNNQIYLSYLSDGTVAATYGCDDGIDKDVKKMICCFDDYSVQQFQKSYDVVLSFYESPTLDENPMDYTVSNATLILDQLNDIEFKCFRATRLN